MGSNARGHFDGNEAKYWRNQQSDTSAVTGHVCRSVDKQDKSI